MSCPYNCDAPETLSKIQAVGLGARPGESAKIAFESAV